MNISDRMKMYEAREAGRTFLPRLPICVRVDGRRFHQLLRRAKKPFDPRFMNAMDKVTQALLREFNPIVALYQSDEVSFVLLQGPKSEPPFGGKVHKITSMAAAVATAALQPYYPKALFDARAWNVPSLEEAANVILWRELDASRNSVQMLARSLYSHKQCHGKNTSDLQEMIHQKGQNWNDFSPREKRGVLLRLRRCLRHLTEEERARIPPQHRPDADAVVERNVYLRDSPCPLTKITNKVGFLFRGEDAKQETTQREES